MTQLRKRVEGLETRMSPTEPRASHLVGMAAGETEAEALARYGKPVARDDLVIFLVPGAQR